MDLKEKIRPLVEEIRKEFSHNFNWDFDDSMDKEIIHSLSFGRLILQLNEIDPEILDWLSFFVARRGLDCWEFSCKGQRPRVLVEAIGEYLKNGTPLDWNDASEPTPSPYRNCFYSSTQPASDAVAECARYISGRNPIDVAYCVSSVNCVYEHVLTDHQFREWFIGYAVPRACEKKEMEVHQQEALRAPGYQKRNWDKSTEKIIHYFRKKFFDIAE